MHRSPSLAAGVLTLVVTALCAPLRAQLSVTAVTPPSHSVAAPTAAVVTVHFDTAVDRATVTAASCRAFGRWSGVVPTAIGFADGDRTVVLRPERPYFPGEMVTVSLSTAVRAAGTNAPLPTGYAWSFWTRPIRGSGRFALTASLPVRRPGEPRIRTYGAYAGDLDADGSPDLTLPNEDADDVRIMLNDGCGQFGRPAVHGIASGSVPSPNEGEDFDGDGNLDFAVGGTQNGDVVVFLGDGRGSFRSSTRYRTGRATRGLTVLDADGDGDVDIVTADRVNSDLTLLRNRGDGTFDNAGSFEGGGSSETAVAAADANGDGIADLFVGHYTSRRLSILLGDGAGAFTHSSSQTVQGRPWMIAVGDVNGDGHCDVVSANSQTAVVAVALGDGLGGLGVPAHYPVGSFPLAIDLGDLDGDGDLDFVASNYGGASFTCYWNDGAGGFGSPFTLPAPAAGSCALLVDHDRDGDVDIVGIDELDDLILLYGQTGPSPQDVQAPSCDATLRVDNLAGRGGFGGATPLPVAAGESFFVGLSGPPNASAIPLIGLPVEPGITSPWGRVHLMIEPLESLPAMTTNAFGEAQQRFDVPAGVAVGTGAGLQGVVVDPGTGALRLTNPEAVVVVR